MVQNCIKNKLPIAYPVTGSSKVGPDIPHLHLALYSPPPGFLSVLLGFSAAHTSHLSQDPDYLECMPTPNVTCPLRPCSRNFFLSKLSQATPSHGGRLLSSEHNAFYPPLLYLFADKYQPTNIYQHCLSIKHGSSTSGFLLTKNLQTIKEEKKVTHKISYDSNTILNKF